MKIDKIKYYLSNHITTSDNGLIQENPPTINEIANKVNEIIDKVNEIIEDRNIGERSNNVKDSD